MMSKGGGNDGSGNGGGPCGACKFLRRKCIKGCIFAPYFDSEQGTSHFAAVHKVFGASNASKLLLRLPPHLRLDAVLTLSYEALARVRDPVYGCVSHIFTLQQQVVNLQAELACIQARLSTSHHLPPPPESSPCPPPTTTNSLYSRWPDLTTTSTSDNMVSRSACTSNMTMHRSTTLMSTRTNMRSFPSCVPSVDHQEYEEGDLRTLAREFVNRYLPGVKLGSSSSTSNNKYQVTDSNY